MKSATTFINTHILFFSLLLLGLMVRLVFFSIPPFKIDNDAWIAWSLKLASGGFRAFYEPGYFADYLPGYLYILWLFGKLQQVFSIPLSFYALILKIPPIIADLLLAGFIYFYLLMKRKSISFAALIAGLFIFNPMVIFNSTFWGQADSVLALGIIVTTFLLTQQRFSLASVAAAISFLIKPQSIILGPLFLLAVIKMRSQRKVMQLVFPALLVLLVVSWPFFTNPISGLVEKFFSTAGQYSYTSLFAYNFWGVVGFWIPDSSLFLSLSFQQISIMLFLLFLIISIYFSWQKKHLFWILITLIALGFFFLPTKVHERYLYPAIPLLLIVAGLYKSKFLIYLTMLLSVVSTLNLYYVYVYYNEEYLALPHLLYWEPLYTLLDQQPKMLSLFASLLFCIIVWTIIRLRDAKK